MNQSELVANTCSWRQARENACEVLLLGWESGTRTFSQSHQYCKATCSNVSIVWSFSHALVIIFTEFRRKSLILWRSFQGWQEDSKIKWWIQLEVGTSEWLWYVLILRPYRQPCCYLKSSMWSMSNTRGLPYRKVPNISPDCDKYSRRCFS